MSAGKWRPFRLSLTIRQQTIISTKADLAYWGWDKMAAISQTAFSNAISETKMFKFQLKFHWSLFPSVQLKIFQHWLSQWLGADQATSHYFEPMIVSLLIHAPLSLGLNELSQ